MKQIRTHNLNLVFWNTRLKGRGRAAAGRQRVTWRLDFTNGDQRRRSRTKVWTNGKVRADATPVTPTDDDDDVQLQWKTETIGGRLQI